MATREQLQNQEKNCVEVRDYVELVKKAIEEPRDIEYAKELLAEAENECKFTDDYILVAETYLKIDDVEKAIEAYENAEDNAFEALELGRLAHSIIENLKNQDKATEIFNKALKEAKNINDLKELINLLYLDLPKSELLKLAFDKASKSIKNLDDLYNFVKDLTKTNTVVAKILLKNFEKNVDGIANITRFTTLIYDTIGDRDWAIQILDDAKDEAKFTNEFILLANAFARIEHTEPIPSLLEEAKNFATTAEELYEVALSIWSLQKDQKLTTELLQKSFKAIKEKKTLANLVKFAFSELHNLELAKEIVNHLVNNSNSSDEILNYISLGLEVLNDSELTTLHLKVSLNKIEEPKDLIKFALECYNKISNYTLAKEFFNKALEKSTKFEHYLEIIKNYHPLFGSDEFVDNVLRTCEEISTTTQEFIEIGKIYKEILNDMDNARRCFLTAEEIVASLQDMKLITEIVKKYFSNDEEWIALVDEKLKKREENQSKYDELLKLEKEAKYLNDYLLLVDKIFVEVDDKYYAKKILKKAKELLDYQYLNIENYFKLCKSILKYYKDFNWITSILNDVYKSKIKFINELELFLKLIEKLFDDKETSKNLIETYLNSWKIKVHNIESAIRLSKVMIKYQIPISDIETFLINFTNKTCDWPSLFSLLELSFKHNLPNLQKLISEKIWNNVQNVDQFVNLVKLLRKYNFDNETLYKKVIEFVKNQPNLLDVLYIAENITTILDDEYHTLFFKEIESKLRNAKQLEIIGKIKSILFEGKYW